MITTQEKLTTIRLGGQLAKRFGRTHQFYISSPGEAVRALCSQVEGFGEYLNDPERKTLYKVLVADKPIDPEKELHDLSGSKEIRIAPVIQGAKSGGIFQVVLGAVLIAAAFWTGGASMAAWAGTSGAVATGAFGAGVSMMLGGIAQLLSPQPKLNIQESPNNTPNTSLGIVNTTSQGQPVPIVVGECIVGSTVISAGIFSSDTNR